MDARVPSDLQASQVVATLCRLLFVGMSSFTRVYIRFNSGVSVDVSVVPAH